MPRRLQNKIHSTYTKGGGIWGSYRDQIIALWNSTPNKADFNDHLIREYNNKVDRLGSNAAKFLPNKAGRYIGSDDNPLA